jgi:hypothetical protein
VDLGDSLARRYPLAKETFFLDGTVCTGLHLPAKDKFSLAGRYCHGITPSHQSFPHVPNWWSTTTTSTRKDADWETKPAWGIFLNFFYSILLKSPQIRKMLKVNFELMHRVPASKETKRKTCNFEQEKDVRWTMVSDFESVC